MNLPIAEQAARATLSTLTFQKLSKPVPIIGFPAAAIEAAQMSVRPLRFDFLPRALVTFDSPPNRKISPQQERFPNRAHALCSVAF
jgi:hypothetical protein